MFAQAASHIHLMYRRRHLHESDCSEKDAASLGERKASYLSSLDLQYFLKINSYLMTKVYICLNIGMLLSADYIVHFHVAED